ncbi:hypothetical protein C8Q70DRAFT_1017395 [Cubamyces menziesii]|nr:hypothetical protein C8Q70DRAFT_1017395 [Cubamyces menziesii]
MNLTRSTLVFARLRCSERSSFKRRVRAPPSDTMADLLRDAVRRTRTVSESGCR